MNRRDLSIQVECRAGYRGEETPRRIRAGERLMEVVEVLDRWLGPDHRYFKCRVREGEMVLVRHDANEGHWELLELSVTGRRQKVVP